MASRTPGKSVRLAPDLHAALTRRAQRDGTHGGVTGLVDRLLRDGMRLANGGWQGSTRARTERTEASGARASADSCPPHPVPRRIGDGCGACGDQKAWKR